MPIQRRTLNFHCLECCAGGFDANNRKRIIEEIRKTYETFEKELRSRFSLGLEKIQEAIGTNNEEIVCKLINEIKILSNEAGVHKSYSTVAQMKPKVNEVLVVKPKEKQDSRKTKTDLKQKIDPKELAIPVENIKETKGEAVIINGGNTHTKEIINGKVLNELENYKVGEAVQKNLKIIMVGVEDEYIDGTDQMVLDAVK